MVPPKSHTTASLGWITRSLAWWWGLAEFGPLPTMAKLTWAWPSATNRSDSSRDTAASVRPIIGMSPACNWAATRSAAALAPVSAAISASSLTARSGLVTCDATWNWALGSEACSCSRKVAQARSEMPNRVRPPTSLATSATGSSVSDHGWMLNTSGCSSTRGASSWAITRVASASAGRTSMVSRSRGMAVYPVNHGRSAPSESSMQSTPTSAMRWRTRATRSLNTYVTSVGHLCTSCAGRGLLGVVAGPRQRAGLDMGEAHRHAGGGQPVELLGGPPAVDGQVVGGGAEVLAEGDDVDAHAS